MTPTDPSTLKKKPLCRKDIIKSKTKMVLPTAKQKARLPSAVETRAGSSRQKKKAPPPTTPATAATPAAAVFVTPPTNTQAPPPTPGRSAIKKAVAKKKKDKKSRQPPVKKGSRIKTRRSQIFHLLEPHQQRCLPREHPNYHNYYGDVMCKSVGPKPSYDIRLDVFRGTDDEVVAKGC